VTFLKIRVISIFLQSDLDDQILPDYLCKSVYDINIEFIA